jgi:hypothetical protein
MRVLVIEVGGSHEPATLGDGWVGWLDARLLQAGQR